MAPATRKETDSLLTGRASSTERDPVADQWEPAGTKRKRNPRDSDTRRTLNHHASTTDPKDTGRPATQARQNQTKTYHQEDWDVVSHHRPSPSNFIDLTNDDDQDDWKGNWDVASHHQSSPSSFIDLTNDDDQDDCEGNWDAVSQHRPSPSNFIDLTNDDDQDNGEGSFGSSNGIIQHRRHTSGIRPELLSIDGTAIIATTGIEDTRPVARGELVGGNGIEQETSSIGSDPYSVQQPTGITSAAATSLITHKAQQSLENTHQSAIVDENMLSETGSTTLHSSTLSDTVSSGMHGRNIDGVGNEDQMMTKYKNGRPSRDTCSLPGLRTSWEEIRQSELCPSLGGRSLTRSDEIHKSIKRQITRIIQGYGKCQCDKKGTKDRSDEGCTENCTNKESSILCDDKTCSIGREECQNRWLETWARKEDGLNQHLRIRKSSRFGKELFWNGPVGKDPEHLIAEYRGQLISTDELMARREKQDGGSITEGHFNFEVKSLRGSEHLWLDSTYKGSIARFANHNCDPNCIVIEFLDSDGPRLFLQSVRRINPGDAITISYGSGVPPAYFRATIGLKSQDVPVCYCGHGICQWHITSAVRDMEIWLREVPGNWSRDRRPREPVPRAINLYLPGARHTIDVLDGNCKPDHEEETLRIACGKMISHLQASLVTIMGGNGN